MCIYEHAVIEHHAITVHSTQHIAYKLHKQHSKYAPIRARQRKQTESARASMSSSIYTARRALKMNEETKSARPTRIFNRSQSSSAGAMSEGFACTLLLSLRLLCSYSYFVHVPGCFRRPWSAKGIFQVASLHLKSWTSLSASFIRISFNSSLYL